MEYSFTAKIKSVLKNKFGDDSDEIYEKSDLIKYINKKTRSANKGSKSRSSFASLFAIYVLIEDYIDHNFELEGTYDDYEGAIYSKLFNRQRQLPFGGSLQNHALNNRMNAEFKKYFPESEITPILRKLETNRYWINEHLLKIKVRETNYNLASVILEIIDEYTKTKQDAFQRFIKACEELQEIEGSNPSQVIAYIRSLLEPDVDARLFEIVSFFNFEILLLRSKYILGF